MMMKNIHEAGYVYNYLKLENILVGHQKEDENLYLIDFDYATRYTNKKAHIKEHLVDRFEGDMLFASHH